MDPEKLFLFQREYVAYCFSFMLCLTANVYFKDWISGSQTLELPRGLLKI